MREGTEHLRIMEKTNELSKAIAIATKKTAIGAIPCIGSWLKEFIGAQENIALEEKWMDRFKNYEVSLTALDNRVVELMRLISPEKILAPPLNVIGVAIESAKYQIEDEHLREMFANLIVNSMNSDKTDLAHPAFVEIIKQLSPFDAQFLMQISDKTIRNKNLKGVAADGIGYIIAQLRDYKRLENLIPMEYTLMKQSLKDFGFQNFNGTIDEYKQLLEQATVSIDNLTRLNLVTIRENTPYRQDFAKSDYMKEFVKTLSSVEKSRTDEHFEAKIVHQWYLVRLTEFGISFCDIVLLSSSEA